MDFLIFCCFGTGGDSMNIEDLGCIWFLWVSIMIYIHLGESVCIFVFCFLLDSFTLTQCSQILEYLFS